MAKNGALLKISWLRLFYLLIAAFFIYLIVTQISSLHGSINHLKNSNLGDDVLVFLAIASTYLMAALTYSLISIEKLKYRRTVVVEIGINTLNRLLPAGIGGMGANFLYLLKSGHNRIQAATVVAINNTLGVVGNLLLVAILLLIAKSSHLNVSRSGVKTVAAIAIVVFICLMAIYLSSKVRPRINRLSRQLIKQFKTYRRRKLRLSLGLVSSIGLTLGNALALLYSLHAVDVSLGLTSVLLAYSFAIWLGAIIPAPGGVGSVDAGLVGALVAYHVGLSQAVACVLIFRVISFWLPLVLGIPALIWSRKRGYL